MNTIRFAVRSQLVVLGLAFLAACGQPAPPEVRPGNGNLATLAATDLYFSEYVEGSSNNKAVEIYNGTGQDVDLAGYRVELYTNGSTSVQNVLDLSGSLAAGDTYVIANSQAAAAVLAVADVTGSVTFYNGNDPLVLLKDGQPIDVIGQIGDDANWGANVTLRRKATVTSGDPDGADPFDPALEWEAFSSDSFGGLGCHADGCDEVSAPELGTCSEPATLVSQVQGPGGSSPMVGAVVVVEGVVVGDFQANDGDPFGTDLGGFYLQEEDSDRDDDAATSEGIFVDAPNAENVEEGQVVRVTGTVGEAFGLTSITASGAVVVCGTATPSITDVTLPVTEPGGLERYEGMLVRLPQTLVISEYFNFDRFGEIVLSVPLVSDRPFQPTSYVDPATAPDVQQEVEARRITLDDARSVQNPDPARHPNGEEFTLDHRFRGGDTLTNTVGVLDYSFGLYRIQPTGGAEYSAENSRPGAPEDVGGDLKVASFNVLNYFTTLGSRGADTSEEFERQRAKIVAALEVIDADVVGLIEIENEEEALDDLVAALNEAMGAGTYQAIQTGPIGADEIRVALVYKPTSVTPLGGHAVLDAPDFLDPNGTGEDRNRPALAQTFVENEGGAAVTVVVNHLKSKGSACEGPGDDDAVQGNCNLTRTLAAERLLEWIESDPTGTGDPDYLLVGDYNAYDEEDPIDVLKAGGMEDLLETFGGEFAYTYVFDGLYGHLDYALASSSLSPQVTGTTAWHINADEPDLLDYDMSFKLDAQDALYEATPYRSSDHDPVIVGLDLVASTLCETAEPSVDLLWPPNHELVPAEIEPGAGAAKGSVTVTVEAIRQDEPVNGTDDGDTAPDATVHGNGEFEVRAERDGEGDGRYYHVTFSAVGATERCQGQVRIVTPVSRGRSDLPADGGALYDSTNP